MTHNYTVSFLVGYTCQHGSSHPTLLPLDWLVLKMASAVISLNKYSTHKTQFVLNHYQPILATSMLGPVYHLLLPLLPSGAPI